MPYRGPLFRALNPIFAREPLSGRGAELYGGRFNTIGRPALYASLSIMTAVREANQVGALQPTTLVSYDADIEHVFDGTDVAAVQGAGIDPKTRADPSWRDQMKAQGVSATQTFARRLIAEGFDGLLVRSFAPGARADDLNLVLWRWGDTPPARLILIDDETDFRDRRRVIFLVRRASERSRTFRSSEGSAWRARQMTGRRSQSRFRLTISKLFEIS